MATKQAWGKETLLKSPCNRDILLVLPFFSNPCNQSGPSPTPSPLGMLRWEYCREEAKAVQASVQYHIWLALLLPGQQIFCSNIVLQLPSSEVGISTCIYKGDNNK